MEVFKGGTGSTHWEQERERKKFSLLWVRRKKTRVHWSLVGFGEREPISLEAEEYSSKVGSSRQQFSKDNGHPRERLCVSSNKIWFRNVLITTRNWFWNRSSCEWLSRDVVPNSWKHFRSVWDFRMEIKELPMTARFSTLFEQSGVSWVLVSWLYDMFLVKYKSSCYIE